MKQLIVFLFLSIYLLNQAAYALPAFNRAVETYEFKKKCKFGIKDKMFQKSSAGETVITDIQEKSDKKVISFCSADVHTDHESFSLIIPETANLYSFFEVAVYSRSNNILSPPPCYN